MKNMYLEKIIGSAGVTRFLSLITVCAVVLCILGSAVVYAGEKWPGIDEAVVNKIAREHGRDERPSLFPAAEGDLQLFLFLLAGAVGGFAAGYYWRILLEGKQKRTDDNSTH
jgi:ABC-type cobalt transport system substrate-binding protein